jgi:hypothetical protein
LASGIRENVANGKTDGFVGPIGVFGALGGPKDAE